MLVARKLEEQELLQPLRRPCKFGMTLNLVDHQSDDRVFRRGSRLLIQPADFVVTGFDWPGLDDLRPIRRFVFRFEYGRKTLHHGGAEQFAAKLLEMLLR